jgi:hypothetical protein
MPLFFAASGAHPEPCRIAAVRTQKPQLLRRLCSFPHGSRRPCARSVCRQCRSGRARPFDDERNHPRRPAASRPERRPRRAAPQHGQRQRDVCRSHRSIGRCGAKICRCTAERLGSQCGAPPRRAFRARNGALEVRAVDRPTGGARRREPDCDCRPLVERPAPCATAGANSTPAAPRQRPISDDSIRRSTPRRRPRSAGARRWCLMRRAKLLSAHRAATQDSSESDSAFRCSMYAASVLMH